jgi:hypothetical protein
MLEVGAAELLQPNAGQPIAGRNGGGVGLRQLDHGGSGDLRSEGLAELLNVFLLRLAATGRVRLHGWATEFGQLGELGN